MRVSKERVRHMAESVATHLQQDGQLDIAGDRKAFVDSLEQAITGELAIEDRLRPMKSRSSRGRSTISACSP
jgi:hypothetical protein